MSFPLPQAFSVPFEASTSQIPRFGAWWGILIVGCFYLIQAIGIVVVQFAVGLSVGFTEGSGNGVDLASTDVQVWALPLSLVLGTSAAALISVQMMASRTQSELGLQWLCHLVWNPDQSRKLLNYAFLGLGIGILFLLLTFYVAPPPEDLPQPLFEAMLAAPAILQLGWVLLIVGVFPIIEEVLFRGVLFAGLTQSWGPVVSFLLTTSAFLAVHMPKVLYYWPATVAVSLIGGLTLWIRIRTASLAPGIALHGAYNGVLVGAALLSHHIFLVPD